MGETTCFSFHAFFWFSFSPSSLLESLEEETGPESRFVSAPSFFVCCIPSSLSDNTPTPADAVFCLYPPFHTSLAPCPRDRLSPWLGHLCTVRIPLTLMYAEIQISAFRDTENAETVFSFGNDDAFRVSVRLLCSFHVIYQNSKHEQRLRHDVFSFARRRKSTGYRVPCLPGIWLRVRGKTRLRRRTPRGNSAPAAPVFLTKMKIPAAGRNTSISRSRHETASPNQGTSDAPSLDEIYPPKLSSVRLMSPLGNATLETDRPGWGDTENEGGSVRLLSERRNFIQVSRCLVSEIISRQPTKLSVLTRREDPVLPRTLLHWARVYSATWRRAGSIQSHDPQFHVEGQSRKITQKSSNARFRS